MLANIYPSNSESALFSVVPNLTNTDGGRQIHVASHSRLDISYANIIKSKGATHFLKKELFSKKKLMPEVYDLSKSAEPVLSIEVTFLEGGVVVCFGGLHLGIDMTGLGEVVGLIGMACRGESLEDEAVDKGGKGKVNKERGMANHKSDEAVEDLEGEEDDDHNAEIPDWKTLLTKSPASSIPEDVPVKAIWKYVRFSSANLAKLKTLASPSPPPIPPTTAPPPYAWISTNDALTSFLWHRILLARLPRLTPSLKTTLCRALNARRYLSPPLPRTSLEHCVSCTYTPFPLTLFTPSTPLAEFLPTLAMSLRTSIKEQATSTSLKILFDTIAQTKDKNTISFGSTLDLGGTDVLFSSGAGVGVYDVDFGGLLGKADLVRRPWVECADGGSEGIGYFMPKDREGGVDILVCLREGDWEALEGDEVWRSFGEVIG